MPRLYALWSWALPCAASPLTLLPQCSIRICIHLINLLEEAEPVGTRGEDGDGELTVDRLALAMASGAI